MKNKFKEKTFEDIGEQLMEYLEKDYISSAEEDRFRVLGEEIKKSREIEHYKDRCRRLNKIFKTQIKA